MNEKLGHQAPKGYVLNRYFNHVEISGDLHYCYSHDFVYNEVEEERKQYNGEPCHYTDGRYGDGRHNYFKNCYLYFSRAKWGAKHTLSLKACMRIVNQCRNIPVGTIVDFKRDWYYTSKKSDKVIPMTYRFKVRKENVFDPQYEVNLKSYKRNFDDCEYSQKLTDLLRANGFLVSVSKGNPDFIMGMIATATEYATGKRGEDRDDEGQIATAYGHNMKIGFSSNNNSYRGYSCGMYHILFDYFGEFNKWSQCYELSKDMTPEEVVKQLLAPRDEQEQDFKP